MPLRENYDVIVVGAGPVGAVCAYGLAQKGMSVALIEADTEISRSPRAATTHPATLEMLADLGLLDEIKAQGLVARYFDFWDRETGERVAQFDHEVLKNDTRFPFVVQCEQHKIANLVIQRLANYPDATVALGTTRDFYAEILANCGNRIIGEVLSVLTARVTLLRAKSMSLPGRPQKSSEEMRAIWVALSAHDPAAARDAAIEHVHRARDAAAKAYSMERTDINSSAA